ncbi:MAG: hypothetical protein MK297_02325 [Planctomycetes bacterium]|nr:hypothetical protein [Planctomycetota bacterium]
MKQIYALSLLFVGLVAGCSTPAAPPSGAFVEARTASVFAGACHYGAEYTTAGREAVMAWRFEEGPSAGALVVAVVTSEANLAEGAPRRSVVYTGGDIEACASAMLELSSRDILGEIVHERRGASLALVNDHYELRGGSGVALSGALLPDRACCSMPAHVWYEPLAANSDAIVGHSLEFRCDIPALDARFESSGENDAFVGRFAW